MKPWVREFLLSRMDERGNISEDEYLREIAIPLFCFRRLSRLFNINFLWNVRLVELFGNVLADLPQEVFYELLAIRNLFFLLSKPLAYVQALQTVADKPGIVCAFSERLLELSDTIIRGVISHELAHVLLGHYMGEYQESHSRGVLEDAADQKAIEWGFDFEIGAIRDYIKSVSLI